MSPHIIGLFVKIDDDKITVINSYAPDFVHCRFDKKTKKPPVDTEGFVCIKEK